MYKLNRECHIFPDDVQRLISQYLMPSKEEIINNFKLVIFELHFKMAMKELVEEALGDFIDLDEIEFYIEHYFETSDDDDTTL